MNIGTLVNRAARWYSDKTAVACAGKERTFTEIDENSNKCANSLAKLGLVKGDRVGLYADNSVEYFEAVFGLFKSGIVGVGVNSMLSVQEAIYIINDSGARVVITSPRVAESLFSMKSRLPAVERYICIGKAPKGELDYYEFIKGQSSSPPNVQLEEDDLAQLFYTGGTTGVPKGAMVTHRVVNNVIMNMQADLCHVTQRDIVLSSGSLAHANGYYCLLFFIEGAKIIIPEGYVPKDILSTIEREKVTVLPGYPTTLIRLIDYPDIKKFNLSSLRLITYGASPMPTEKLRKALEIFGNKLAQGYGQAEALMTITFLTPEDHMFALAERPERLASCGRPYLTQEVRVVDNEDNDVPYGQTGEVVTRGKVCMAGYWNQPEATAKTIRGGWVYTGDIGWMDEEGYLYLVDRKKDIIITGGENVYAREVEDVINSHPAVSEAAVIGVPDDSWGESIKAVIALKPGMKATSEEIIQYCKERLSSYKKPKTVEFVDELPKTAANKISKKDLRARYWAGRERNI
jgi:acyl-CoA synthetase (AMP-forming)/AMP-acid ligase II